MQSCDTYYQTILKRTSRATKTDLRTVASTFSFKSKNGGKHYRVQIENISVPCLNEL